MEFLNSLIPYFEKNNKANKEAVARLRATHEELFEGVEKVTKKIVNTLLSNSENWEFSTEEQRNLWSEYESMLESEKALKDEKFN